MDFTPTIEPAGLSPSIARERASSTTAILDHALVYGLCAIVMFGPLAFGAVEEWAKFMLEVGAALLLAIWILRQAVAGAVRISGTILYLPALAFAAVVAAQVLFRTAAVARVTQNSALLYAAYGVLFFVTANCFSGEKRRKTFLYALSGFGLLVAIFAILQDVSSNHKIYWLREVTNSHAIFGPYVNRNHYAGLMEMLAPFPLVALLNAGVSGGKRMLLGFASVLMAASVFLSLSRGGMVSIVAELLFLAALLRLQRRQKWAPAVVLASIFAVVVFLAWFGPGHVLDRISSLLAVDGSGTIRASIVRDSISMVRAHPLLGWGLGTFPDVYPPFRSFYTVNWINAAHNDYVQMAVETGLAGFFAAVAFLVFVFAGARRNLRSHAGHYTIATVLASVVGVVGILVHSAVDFNLQIPANAMLFYVLCAMAAVPVGADHPRAKGSLVAPPRVISSPRPGPLLVDNTLS